MSNVPFFSIIVPVYNVEHYLGECIDSVISQTYEDYEIILIDDGSTDNSGSICDLYKKTALYNFYATSEVDEASLHKA